MLFPEAMIEAAADRAACRALLADGSRSFHAASHLLPLKVREPATALYAFCRLADDAVDVEGGPTGRGRAAALARLRVRLDRAYAGTPMPLPADRAFAAAVTRHAIPRELPEALLEGLAWDADGRRYETLADLHAYAARVAGAVGVMMAVLMGVRDRDALARACDLGAAMQLTNIARDVGEDARVGRLYLPLAWLREEGVDPGAFLRAPSFKPAIGRVVARVLAEADRLYAAGERGVGALPLACRPGIGAARLLYAAIGDEVARRGHDSVASRAVVPTRTKLALLARAPALAWPRGPDRAPPLPAAAFLIEAVALAPPPRRRTTLRGQALWVIDLFERVEQRRQLEATR